jgi:hypothetical protein
MIGHRMQSGFLFGEEEPNNSSLTAKGVCEQCVVGASGVGERQVFNALVR